MEPDRVGQLQFFLLRGTIESIVDPARSAEDRESRRARLEGFILAGGARMLAALRGAFVFCDPAVDQLAVEWLIDFVASLGPEWLREVDVTMVEQYWKVAPNPRAKSKAAEFILRMEFSQDQPLLSAHLSRLVSLFRQFQEYPVKPPLSLEAKQIVDVLLKRASLTSPSTLENTGIGRYSLYVLRYCFVGPGQQLSPKAAEDLIPIASELGVDRQEAFRRVLLTTL